MLISSPLAFSSPLHRCVPCPAGTTTLTPGTASELRCLPPGEVDEELDDMFATETLIKKLVAIPALEQKVPKSEKSEKSDGRIFM